MRPTAILTTITKRFNAGIKRALFLKSSPGIGKTELASQAAKALDVAFMSIHAPLLQPEDYGFPVISADKKDVSFIVSKTKFPVEGSDCPDKGIFLIDELSQADTSAQKILANLLQEKEIHGQKIKAGWMIVATGNRAQDRSGANAILRHLGNRVTQIEMETSIDDWTEWALQNNVKPEVIAFLRFRPELLNKFDANAEVSATPRAWVQGVSQSLGVCDASEELETFQGDVGEGPAAEFCAFLKIYRKLPSPDSILLDPKGAKVPSDPATIYALCGALAHKTTENNFDSVMTYISRLPAEFSVLFVRDAIKLNEALKTTKTFIAWASRPGAKLLF